MPTYVLAVYDDPAGATGRREVELGTELGYSHAVVYDDPAGGGAPLAIASEPEEEPPLGELPIYPDPLGGGAPELVPFELGGPVSGGDVVSLRLRVHRLVDLRPRAYALRVAQLGDALRVRVRFDDESGEPVDLTSATGLQVVLERADATPLVRDASLVGPATDGVVEAQLQPSEVQSVGEWRAQGVGTLAGGGVAHTDVGVFPVRPNLPVT